MKYIGPLTRQQAIELNERISLRLGYNAENRHAKTFAEIEQHSSRPDEYILPLKARFEDLVLPHLSPEEQALIKDKEVLKQDSWFEPKAESHPTQSLIGQLWDYLFN